MAYSVGAIGHGAGLLYRVTGYEPAMELSGGLARWALARLFNRKDGRNEHWHFHHGMATLMAVCEYGYAVNDRELLERVDACYRWVREMGDPMVGFFTEYMPGYKTYMERQGNTVEICEVADMVFLALYLTRAGTGDYWDDVDQWVRNMLAEGQMVNTDFLSNIPESYFRRNKFSKPHMMTDNEAERAVGSFFGWMRANDGLMIEQTEQGPKLFDNSIMHCCTANGARALYFVWDSIVTKQADEVRVNLLLNRASPWLDVDSYLPVEGKVVLHIKDAPKVSVRMPKWCNPSEVCVSVAGQPRRALFEGHFIQICWLKPSDVVVLKFPVVERWMPRVIGEIPYKLTLRGSNVVDIEPKGIACPLYQNQPTGKLLKKTRFIPKISRIIW